MIRYYQTSKLITLVVGFVVWEGICVGFPIHLSFDKDMLSAGGVPIPVMVVLLLNGTIPFFTGPRLIYLMRPIMVDEQGITAFWRGRPWKFLAWKDVQKIEKSYIPIMFERPQEVITVYGSDKSIRFDDWIWNYEDLLKDVSSRARYFNIPTFERKGKTINTIILFGK